MVLVRPAVQSSYAIYLSMRHTLLPEESARGLVSQIPTRSNMSSEPDAALRWRNHRAIGITPHRRLSRQIYLQAEPSFTCEPFERRQGGCASLGAYLLSNA